MNFVSYNPVSIYLKESPAFSDSLSRQIHVASCFLVCLFVYLLLGMPGKTNLSFTRLMPLPSQRRVLKCDSEGGHQEAE